MEFSLTRIGNSNMHLYDSEEESRVQLIFIPGVFSMKAWKYQVNYFSQDYRTISFRPTVSNRSFEGHRESLKQILDQEEIDRAILISANYSNPLVQSFEAREDVAATVVVGAKKKMKKNIPEEAYRGLTSKYFPTKLVKKFFFPSMRYRDVRDFCSDVDLLDFEEFQTFQEKFGVRKPEKECMVIHGRNDFFSSRGYCKDLMSSASVMVLDSGPFSFYEKPQEFNKTLNDFLIKIERKAMQEEIEESKDQNRTLEEFEERRMAKVKNR